MSLRPGVVVVAYLREPREQVVGKLLGLDGAGVTLRGLGVDAFEDWSRELAREESSGLGPATVFYPLARVEKILLDETQGPLLSLARRFAERTRLDLAEVLEAGDDSA